MKRSDLLSSGYVPPVAPPLPRMDAKGVVKPAKKVKKQITGKDMNATATAEDRRMKRRIKAFYANASGPIVNLSQLIGAQAGQDG